MPKISSSLNPSCRFCNSKCTIKKGTRKSKYRTTQKYQCTNPDCNKYFTTEPQLQTNKTYSPIAIISTISKHNLGTPLRQHPFPKSTVLNWVKSLNLPMQRLRHQIKDQPPYKTIKQKRFIHHNQPFLYQYHILKLNFAKRFPGLRTYLTHLYLPKKAFKSTNSKRISLIAKSPRYTPNIKLNPKQNYATQLAKLAQQITANNRDRHQIIENLMITNDTSTIATEIPVYSSNKNHPNNITGHIDILQIRYNKLYLLDYKPEPINEKQTITQLLLYRHLLSKRTKIKKENIKLAFFNEKGYYEIN